MFLSACFSFNFIFISMFLSFSGHVSGLEDELKHIKTSLSKAEAEKRQLQEDLTALEKVCVCVYTRVHMRFSKRLNDSHSQHMMCVWLCVFFEAPINVVPFTHRRRASRRLIFLLNSKPFSRV